MPTNSTKRKRWLRDLGDHHRKVQRARLDDALLSDYSSISKHSSSESDGRQANADAPLDLSADLEQLNHWGSGHVTCQSYYWIYLRVMEHNHVLSI